MSVKLARYVFKRIRGRIVPIRVGIERANKSVNKLVDKLNKFKEADSELRSLKKVMPHRKFPTQKSIAKKLQSKVLKGDFKKVGSGVDFDVFKRKKSSDFVIKTEKVYGGKTTKGTTNKWLNKKHPELSDKLAVSKTLGDNLPDFGIPTESSEIIRLKKGERGLLQKFVKPKESSVSSTYLRKDSEKLLRDTGLNIDAHGGNITNGKLIDTGANLRKSSAKLGDTAKEMLGIDNNYGSKIKDSYNKSTILSDEAILSGTSKNALKRINNLIKKGYKYKKTGKDEYKLVFHKNRKK